MVTGVEPVTSSPPPRRLRSHLLLGLVAVLLFAGLHRASGIIPIGNGEGWDGADYARMLRQGWASGTVITQYRPLVVWANWPAYAVTGDAVRAFAVMNDVYTFALIVMLSLLMQRYGASLRVRAVALVCICLSVPFRLFAFYPVLIDLGACLAITLALWFVLTGPRWAAAVSCLAAMLSREFAPAVLLFGVHRDLRHRVPLRTIAATYVPAAVVYVALRVVVQRVWAGSEDGITLEFLWRNKYLWRDPMFIGLFTYFVLTIGGGVALVTAGQPLRCWRFLREEPEWISFVAPILIASAFVGMDTMRYVVALLPAAVVLFARCSREWSPWERVTMPLVALSLTVWTQEPFRHVDVARYFADWFPYYIVARQYPQADPPSLFPEWGWRFLVVVVSLCVLLIVSRRDEPRLAAN